MLVASAGYYAYGTNTAGAHVPVLYSEDLERWQYVGDALAALPAWVQAHTSSVWAPSVTMVDGHYVMYVSIVDTRKGVHCIAVGHSSTPTGPFVVGEEPLVCERGAIDASPFRTDDGRLWLTWKFEAASIVSQQLSADGLELVGARATLLIPTLAWEHGVVEGPSMTYVNGSYLLFYAAANWQTATYATGVARCSSPSGPCTKSSIPVMSTSSAVVGPGGLEVFTVGGHTYVAFHAWVGGVGYPGGNRVLHVHQFNFSVS